MNELFLFDSQLKKYKTPFGAAVCGEKINLSAYALRTEILSVTLLLFSEYDNSRTDMPMSWNRLEKGYDVYSLEFNSSDTPGIFWYCFLLNTVDGRCLFFGKNGIRDNLSEILSYQLTVYSKGYSTPEWYSKGVTYHVFVDRFFRASKSPKIYDDPYFIVHENKSETPVFMPNELGVVENRDIYGGNLEGVIEKLPYLKELGVKTIYLSPVFEAWSNHKYNTADYKKIDGHFGDENTLSTLCEKASEYDMRVILDGVFSHTGSDSLYFNHEGRYGEKTGAWRDGNSPYRPWYDIGSDGKYSSWWGIDTLPQVDEMNEDYRSYIINGEDSVIAHWMRAGVSGWRLDVADELPDEFISQLKKRSVGEKKDALVIGEVWEDASTKKAYGVNKKYFTDGVLDGVMNYPLKNCILDFVCGRIPAENAKNALMTIVENYPEISQRCLMNIIGTHDTVRAINELSVGSLSHMSKEFRAERMLSRDEENIGKQRLKLAAVIQYMFPGSPCIYYGDEIGMQGFEDPFNRRFFTWDDMDCALLSFYQKLGKVKANAPGMHNGRFSVLYAHKDVLAVSRGDVLAVVNRGERKHLMRIPAGYSCVLNSGTCKASGDRVLLSKLSSCILIKE